MIRAYVVYLFKIKFILYIDTSTNTKYVYVLFSNKAPYYRECRFPKKKKKKKKKKKQKKWKKRLQHE